MASEVRHGDCLEVVRGLAGGSVGILAGVAVPLSVELFTDISIPISPVAIAVAFGVSCLVGLVFGILPANRAAPAKLRERLAQRRGARVLYCRDTGSLTLLIRRNGWEVRDASGTVLDQ